MTPFFIFLATACAPIVVIPGFGGGIKEDVCVQQLVRTSTSSVVMEGETAYRVIRPGMPFCAEANEACGRNLKLCMIEFLWESHRKEKHDGEFGLPCDMCLYWYNRAQEELEERWEDEP